MENLSINIATANGTGSLSANHLLTKTLFRAGWPVGAYNFFPSNIAGLPCLYSLRLNSKGYTGFSDMADVLISLNPKNLFDDLNSLKPQGLLVSDEKDKTEQMLNGETPASQNFSQPQRPFQGLHWALPISQALKKMENLSLKKKIWLKNMIYAGIICEWLKIEKETVQRSIKEFFQKAKSEEIIRQNSQAVEIGRSLAGERPFPFSPPAKTFLAPNSNSPAPAHKKNKAPSPPLESKPQILIDGNTSMALGALFSGCQFVSWYPITPATSLAESFSAFAQRYQKDKEGKRKFAVLQAEDELAAAAQAIGAGWAGLRAMTVTSGPGLSLMSEGAGLSYFAEVPVVLCNIQRAGPSTGLPTRTQQSDLLSACFLSHGDSKHIVLMPGTAKEAFELTARAFDLAEELQTLVIVLSDLDLGMNLKMCETFTMDSAPLKRGKVLREKDLRKGNFLPYKDLEGDGVSCRTLPGVRHSGGAYLTRGSGHNEKAEYSERPQDYAWKLDKLKKKWETAKKMLPEPVVESFPDRTAGFVTFGPNEQSLKELRDSLELKGILTNFMRIRSFPFPQSVESFLKEQTAIFVVELNRDGQLRQVLSGEFPEQSHKMKSLLQYDGRPLAVDYIRERFYKLYSKTNGARRSGAK